MAYQEPQYEYQTMTTPVIQLPEVDRATFVARVYQHVAMAVAAFIGFEVVLFVLGIAETMEEFFLQGGGGRWLLLLGGVMVGQMFASRAAANISDPGLQYAGLFGTALIEALIFAPFLSYVFGRPDGGATVVQAAVLTIVGFAALTAIGMFTRADLSWMRGLLMWGGVVAILLIVGAVIFGFGLGTWFSVAMIGLAGGVILYQTQSVVRSYPKQAHVAAAVVLFSALMTMFWYVLRLLMSRD